MEFCECKTTDNSNNKDLKKAGVPFKFNLTKLQNLDYF
jgi:hypothetical protein